MQNVLEFLETTTQQFPDKTAVIHESQSMTYQDFNGLSKRIGSALITKQSVRKPVVFIMDKDCETLAGFMGCVYAGCYSISIPLKQPLVRMNQILAIAEDALVVVHRDVPINLDQLVMRQYCYYEDLVDVAVNEDELLRIRNQALDIDPLYCNFTSGTTGVPKGVVVSHRSVLDFIPNFTRLFGIGSADVIANQAPFDFDVSIKDIYSAFSTGATLVIVPTRLFSVVTQLLDYLVDFQVTTLIWAVSALCLVTQFKGLTYKVPTTVDKILFSGEVMPIRYLNQWRDALPACTFTNLYGPTEITCNCTYHTLDRVYGLDQQIPIGKPFPNEKVMLLGENDEEVIDFGQRGEICVSGTCLALGYLNNYGQTQRSFVQNPLNPHYLELIYRTGDLGYYESDGNLRFGGRKDFQIKHMGHRIELEEIEVNLNALDGVVRACCLYDEPKSRIIAFYVGDGDPKGLRSALQQRLQHYMIPSVFKQLESMPLSDNGKINRKELRERMVNPHD